jgi:hypothetical protein
VVEQAAQLGRRLVRIHGRVGYGRDLHVPVHAI